jgi:membrane dipeptidase
MRSAMRWMLVFAVAVCVAGPADARKKKRDDEALLAEARAILADVPLIDGHNDMPWQLRKHFANHLDQVDFHDTTGTDPPMHTDITRLRAGGVGGVFWSIWVRHEEPVSASVTAALEQIDVVQRLAAAYPDDLEIALTAADVRRIHGEGKVASLIGLEGGYVLDDSLAVLRQLHALGARYLTLTHWNTTTWCDASTAAPQHGGLSPFGEAVVLELNRLGMLVDLSHVSLEAMNDAMDISRAPVICSHSGAAVLNPHPRNVPDDELRRIADGGGVVMIPLGSFFLDPSIAERHAAEKGERARLEVLIPGDPEELERQLEAWGEAHPFPVVPLAVAADHIDHIRDVAGIDHVGIGSDLDGVRLVPEGLEDVACFPALIAELLYRGYTREDVEKIVGLNVLRVMEDVERVAVELQAEPARDLRIDELSSPPDP